MAPDFLRPVEQALNRQIAGSGRARAMLAGLAGRSLELRFRATPLRVRIAAAGEALSVGPAAGEAADAVIEGTPLSFLALAAGDAAKSIRAGGMDVSGDAEVAEGFRRLLEAARPDLEEELSRFTGDAAAHWIAGFAREAAGFGRRAGDSLARSLSEYLTEESRDVPVRLEVEEFLDGVDRLREAADRLEARVAAAERARGRA
jgi:ubiquinone biosynthesis accessory factor UbiJ